MQYYFVLQLVNTTCSLSVVDMSFFQLFQVTSSSSCVCTACYTLIFSVVFEICFALCCCRTHTQLLQFHLLDWLHDICIRTLLIFSGIHSSLFPHHASCHTSTQSQRIIPLHWQFLMIFQAVEISSWKHFICFQPSISLIFRSSYVLFQQFP